MEDRETARFRATAGAAQGLGATPQEALGALIQSLPEELHLPIVILPYNQGDPFFTHAQQERLQELKSRKETLTSEERAELEGLVAAAFDATIARSYSSLQLRARRPWIRLGLYP